MKTVDVGAAIDEGRWTGYQKLLIFGTALTIILDGIDNQILPNAIPYIAPQWFPDMAPAAASAQLRSSLAWGPAGMMIGGLLGGVIGDKLGRRTALLFSVITFAILTFLVALIDSVFMLSTLRFLAGVGLGGAMPNAAALASEYVPRRQRPFAVTLTIVCIPLGGFVASTMTRLIAPQFGWQGLFITGGIVPLILAAVLFKVLPESPRYLVGRRERWSELTTTMRRIGHAIPDDVQYVEAAAGAGPVRKAAIRDLFAPQYVRDTLGLFGSFFLCLMVNYVVIQLLTSTLRDHGGFTPDAAPSGLQWVNIGGVAGAVLGALVIQRIGSRATMLGMSAAAIGFSLVLVRLPIDPGNPFTLLALLLVTGGLLNAVQTTMYALAAHVYPTEIRSTGVGTAVAFGRVGNILAVYVGGYALDRAGVPGYFGSWTVLMALVFISLAVIQRHVPRSSAVAAAAAGPVASR
jgi:MFS transporter, AAHS family, 4-hydroxybenzoate transporter